MHSNSSPATSSIPSKGFCHDAKVMSKLSEGDLRKLVNRALNLDRQAVRKARLEVAQDVPNFESLNLEQQENLRRQAALDVVERRKRNNRYVSCDYPVFKGYLPPTVDGESAHCHRQTRQLVDLQVEASLGTSVKRSGKAHWAADDEEDDEEPIPQSKKQDDGDSQRLSDIAPYDAQRENWPSAYQHTKNGDGGREKGNEDGKDETSEAANSEDGGSDLESHEAFKNKLLRYHGPPDAREKTKATGLGRKKQHKRHPEKSIAPKRKTALQNSNDDHSHPESSPEPMMAIIRGQPLLDSDFAITPAPVSFAMAFKRQRFVTGIERAIIRGQVFDDHTDEDEDDGKGYTIRVARKRRSESRDCVGQKKARRAKVAK